MGSSIRAVFLFVKETELKVWWDMVDPLLKCSKGSESAGVLSKGYFGRSGEMEHCFLLLVGKLFGFTYLDKSVGWASPMREGRGKGGWIE